MGGRRVSGSRQEAGQGPSVGVGGPWAEAARSPDWSRGLSRWPQRVAWGAVTAVCCVCSVNTRGKTVAADTWPEQLGGHATGGSESQHHGTLSRDRQGAAGVPGR